MDSELDASLPHDDGRPDASHAPAALGTATALLHAAAEGDPAALDALFPLVYDELSILAHQQRRRWHGDLTLNTTALVHETYLKVAGQERVPASSRAHFLALASCAMRHILCNRARDRLRLKRGGGATHVSLDDGQALAAPVQLSADDSDTLEVLDQALRALAQHSARAARVVECRFFGGMSVEDTAVALETSERTVKRDWVFARAWLRRDMQQRLS